MLARHKKSSCKLQMLEFLVVKLICDLVLLHYIKFENGI